MLVEAASRLPGSAQQPTAPQRQIAPLSEPVRLLVQAVALLKQQVPADLPAGQALAEAAVVLREWEKLTALSLARLGDVHVRELHTLDGAPTTGSWVEGLQVGLDRGSVGLAKKLRRLPGVAGEVESGGLSLPAAIKVGQAIDRVRPFLDRPDGLLDGQPQDRVLHAVIVDGILDLLGQARGGWPDNDHDLLDLHNRLTGIACTAGSAVDRLEEALVVLAQQLEPAWLHPALGRLVDALLPLQHESRVARAHRERAVRLVRDTDGSGWHLSQGRLDLECGELLHTVLTAQQAIDPAGPADTAGWAAARAAQPDDPAGWVVAHRAQPAPGAHGDALLVDADELLLEGTGEAREEYGATLAPRSLRQQHHDALKLALRRLLASGALGTRDKVAPHLVVTVSLERLHDAAGALPATTASGSSLPSSLVRELLCDSRLTRVVLDAGHRVVEISHTERTLKAHERIALNLQWGGRCAGAGCVAPPGGPLVPHHATPWHLTGTTSLADSVPFCEATHHDLHVGGRTVRLRDGRYLSPVGWVTGPPGRDTEHERGAGP